MAILKDNEYTEFEGRDYINPQVSLDESNAFIDNLRSTQQANTQQIKTDTYNLGTAVPSNLGGLTGGEGYWTSRYQTPQTNSLTNDLRTTAQASALNQVLQNEQEKWKKRYNDAYNNAKKRASGGGGSNLSDLLKGLTEGGVDVEDSLKKYLDDYTWEQGDTPVTYTHDLGNLSAGMSEFWDLFSGKYNYTLPTGVEVEEGGTDEELVYGSDGNYYMWNKKNGTYTPILGDSGQTGGGGRWWKK